MNTDIPALAAALKRVLAQPGSWDRQSAIGGGITESCYHAPPGSYAGSVSNLFGHLIDDEYRPVLDRPHHGSQMRAALVKHAHVLHRDYGIIVSVNRQKIELYLAEVLS